MSRVDHVAYRTPNKDATAKFFIEAFNYKIQQYFDIPFDDGTTANCIALEPPEKIAPNVPWTHQVIWRNGGEDQLLTYHMAPEIFISSSNDPNSIVGSWVEKRKDSCSFLHHIAYQVDNSVEATMKEWQEKGWAEFSSDEPIKCPEEGLTQVFSKPHSLTGVVFEFIERKNHGFCRTSVRDLMLASKRD